MKEYYTRGVSLAADIGSIAAVTHYSGGNPSATYYLHNNHRGDVILARQGTSTAATLEYTPYGELRSQTGSYQPRFRFSSKEYDASTGFYHFPYRYYAPQWARWITRDPWWELTAARPLDANVLFKTANLYAYVRGNPVDREDPKGLMAHLWPEIVESCTGHSTWDPDIVYCYLQGYTDHADSRECFYRCTDDTAHRRHMSPECPGDPPPDCLPEDCIIRG